MYNYSVGLLLAIEREKKEIAQRSLASGVCTHQILGRIEKGECDTDKLVMDILFQRLGKSPDKLECILSKEEYSKIKERDLIEQLILKGKDQKAEYLLEHYHGKFTEKDYVQQMYYHRTRAYLYERCKGDMNQAMTQIQIALDYSMPNWRSTVLSDYLISTYEMENLLYYDKLLYLQGNEQESVELLDRLLVYIREHFSDEEERCKVLPKCVWLLSCFDQEEKEDFRILALCEEALQLLRQRSVSYFMVPLMKETVKRYQRIGAQAKVTYWSRFMKTLERLYQKYAPDLCQQSLFLNCYQCEYHLDYEIIRSERTGMNMTQEELIEGVYQTPTSISNLEQGKSSPNRTKFGLLMRKLNLEKNRYNGYAVTNSFEVLDLVTELNGLLIARDSKAANQKNQQISTLLDCNINENRRYLRLSEINVKYLDGTIGMDEAIQVLSKLLDESYHMSEYKNLRVPLRNELYIINMLAICMSSLHREKEALELCLATLRSYRNSKVNRKYHYRSYSLIQAKTCKLLDKEGVENQTKSMAQSGISYELTCGKGGILNAYLLRLISKLDKNKIIMLDAYVISELFYDKNYSLYIKEYYMQSFNEEISEIIGG